MVEHVQPLRQSPAPSRESPQVRRDRQTPARRRSVRCVRRHARRSGTDVEGRHQRPAADLARSRPREDRAHRRNRRHGGGRSCPASRVVPERQGRRNSTCSSISMSATTAPARVPLAQALEIAEAVDRASNLHLRGLQAYSVVGSHASPDEERHTRVAGSIRARRRNARRHGPQRTFDRNPLRRQHRHLANRHRASRTYRIAGRIVRTDGPGLPPRWSGFPPGHHGARDRRQRQSRKVCQRRRGNEIVFNRSRLWTGSREPAGFRATAGAATNSATSMSTIPRNARVWATSSNSFRRTATRR